MIVAEIKRRIIVNHPRCRRVAPGRDDPSNDATFDLTEVGDDRVEVKSAVVADWRSEPWTDQTSGVTYPKIIDRYSEHGARTCSIKDQRLLQ